MPKPTKEDASLLLQIFGIGTADERYAEASRWFNIEMNEKNYDDYKKKYPIGSEGAKNFNRLCSYWELIGTLVNKELLSEDLVFDLFGDLMWDKAKPIVYGLRKDLNMPRFMENYEVCAKMYPEWSKKNPIKV